MSGLQFTSVEILPGTWEGDATPRWFINVHGNDGSQIIMDMKLSHGAAVIAANEYGVPVTDHTAH